MAFVDYYQILGISKNASEKEVKNAYRRQARKFHPDLNPNDRDAQKKFQEINEANEVLSDSEKRKKYDQYGKDWKHANQYEAAGQGRPGAGRPAGGQQTYSGNFGESDFSDFFSSMFGGSARQSNLKGQDFNAELRLSLRDVYTTQQRTITVNSRNIRLTIPAGVENGQIIKIKGHGAAGRNGGPFGDLFLTFLINEDPEFKRKGNDLFKNTAIDLYTAILGGEIQIDTLSGKVKLQVKPGTQNGTKVKLKGKGFPVYKNESLFGDLYITYSVQIPTNLTETEKELFFQLNNIRK
jgi:curved DNA-binding protein